VPRIALLGATGSIGLQALDVIDAHPGLDVCALAARASDRELVAAATARGVDRIALEDPAAADRARAAFDGHVGSGPDAVAGLAAESGADLVLNAVVGSAGLDATLAALDAGLDVALANKESLVAGGPLVLAARRRTGARIVPVDSEHSALHQLLAREEASAVDSLVITASGGPFRGRTRAELEDVTVAEALAHPTWAMGPRITIDSATLMNKGLELIEAHFLFGLPYEQLEVVVHPQSVVHALVRLRDGALLAHLGLPDMRVPIAYALGGTARLPLDVPRLDLVGRALEFEPVDEETFPCLALARDAGRAGGVLPCALNAADEAAVEAFVAGRCGFLDIGPLVERALEAADTGPVESREQLRDVDARARAVVQDALAGVAP
jgi:1-deoxy-D-xylulose-5-phosphate reductoisomerase